MALTFVVDENLRGPLQRAIGRHNASGVNVIDAVWVGEPPDLPLGSQDPDILIWAEANDRLLVSHDPTTMPLHFTNHLAAGRHLPGLLLVRPAARLVDLVATMAVIAHAGDSADYLDAIEYIPWP